jgi:ribosomal protein S5
MAKRNSEIQVVGNRLGRVGEGLGRRFVDIIDA